MKKLLIAILLIGVVTLAVANLPNDLSTQQKLFRQELTRLEQLEKAVIQQTAIVNQRRGILEYIQYQIEQETEKIYENDIPKEPVTEQPDVPVP